jgi:hypothetical protein
MALEERNGNLYYYQKKRYGNRVKSEYIGKGEAAFLISQMDILKREKRLNEVEKERKKRLKIEKIDQELSNFEQNIKTLVKAYLLSRGFFQTQSREWRIKINGNNR